jgi:SPP1 gp7 family putative phage head morphogenesis protein
VVRGFTITYPVFLEESYKKQLVLLVDQLKSLSLELLPSNFQSSFNQATRSDDVTSELERYIKAASAAISIEAASVIQTLSQRFTSVREFTQRSFDKSFAHIARAASSGGKLGVTSLPISAHTPNLELLKKMWIEKNTQLIKDIPAKALEKIRDAVYEAVRSGESLQSLSSRISQILESTGKRAKLIARDQIAKLKSDLSRHNDLMHGLTIYEWRTCGDDAVRASHKVMQGKICSWLDPSIYKDKPADKWKKRSSIGGVQKHVGADIICRCTNIILMEQVAV